MHAKPEMRAKRSVVLNVMTFAIAWVGGEHIAPSHTLLARVVRGGRYYFRRASTQRKPSQ